MNYSPLQELPLGTASFTKLRNRNQIYVDKTDLIFELARNSGKYFLARPRRFGKSLLISTFKSLFKDGLEYFKGLAIEKLWKEKRTYSVITVDFSEIKDTSVEEFDNYFAGLIVSAFSLEGFKFNEKSTWPLNVQLSNWLKTREEDSLVLLIDEYDAPLTECINDCIKFDFIRKRLSSFYSIIKANDQCLRFLFITGITKFSKASLFSGLNIIQDISLSPTYATLLGYSHSEVQTYFKGYIEKASEVLQIKEEKLFSKLTKYYDGFCFDLSASNTLFSPWSVLNFFSDPVRGFENYWFNSSGQPTVLTEYFSFHTLNNLIQFDIDQTVHISLLTASSNIESLDEKVLLTQTGYLTIKAYDPVEEIITLGFPNVEVEKSMALLCLSQILKGKSLLEIGSSGILKAFINDDLTSVLRKINNALLAIDYLEYPLTNELRVRTAIMLILQGAGIEVLVERHNAKGRSDLEFTIGSTHWVIELKFIKEAHEADRLLYRGEKQIRLRHYGEQSSTRSLKRLVLVFSAVERKIIRYAVCD